MLNYIFTVLLYGLISTIAFWRLTWPFTCKISIYFQKGLVTPRKSIFENKGTGIFSLGILQEPEFREDPLKL